MVARKVEYNKKGRLLSTFCTPAGARTLDTLIKSQVLYQLSYGCNIFCSSFRAFSELRVQRYGVFLNLPNFFETFFEKRQKNFENNSFTQYLLGKHNYFYAL